MMRFFMIARINLSHKINIDDLRSVIESARPLLHRGAPKGEKGCEILEYGLEDQAIVLKLQSGKYVRPHDAILRLKSILLNH